MDHSVWNINNVNNSNEKNLYTYIYMYIYGITQLYYSRTYLFLLSFATKSRTRQHIFTSYHRFKLANSTLSPTLFFHSAVERIGAHRRQVPKPVPRAITISR